MTIRQRGWRVPAALVALSADPASSPGPRGWSSSAAARQLIPADARFTASPLPVVVHIVCAAVPMHSSARSSSSPGSGDAARAGTGAPAGCSSSPAWRGARRPSG